MFADLSKSDRLLLPRAAPPPARRGGAVLILTGLGIEVFVWHFFPSPPGLPGLFFLFLRIPLTLVGAAFVLLGAGIGWSRVGVELDRDSGHLLLLRRVLFWTWRRPVPVERIGGIRVVTGRGSGGIDVGFIEIHFRDGAREITFGEFQDAAVLRRLAAWLRDRLELPAAAVTGLEPGVAAPPLVLEGEAAVALDRLAASPLVRTQWSTSGLVVELPPVGWRGFELFLLAMACGAAALLVILASQAIGRPGGPPWWVPAVFGAIPVSFFLAALHRVRKRVRLSAENGVLRVEEAGLFGQRERSYPASEIFDIRAIRVPAGSNRPTAGLVILGRGRIPVFQIGHPALDREFELWEAMAKVLLATLTTPAAGAPGFGARAAATPGGAPTAPEGGVFDAPLAERHRMAGPARAGRVLHGGGGDPRSATSAGGGDGRTSGGRLGWVYL